jgi:hypothetical protein
MMQLKTVAADLELLLLLLALKVSNCTRNVSFHSKGSSWRSSSGVEMS